MTERRNGHVLIQKSYLKMCVKHMTAKIERNFPPPMVSDQKKEKKKKPKKKKKKKQKQKLRVGAGMWILICSMLFVYKCYSECRLKTLLSALPDSEQNVNDTNEFPATLLYQSDYMYTSSTLGNIDPKRNKRKLSRSGNSLFRSLAAARKITRSAPG